jgi:hypothetical protein
LTQLAAFRGQPFILCFDQVDNLDADQAAALARFLEALIDSSSNLFVVTAGIQASLLRWRQEKVIQDSAWDRLAQFEVSLQRVDPETGNAIVRARLGRFLEPFREVGPIRERLEQDPLFPLGRAWAADFFHGKIDVRPREVINGAREGWRRQQEAVKQLGGDAWLDRWDRAPKPDEPTPPPTPEQVNEAIDRKVTEKIAEFRAQRLHDPATLPPDAANLSGLVGKLLEQCRQADPASGLLALERPEPAIPGQRRTYDLVLRQRLGTGNGERRTALLFLATTSATSTAADLRRMVQDGHAPDRIFLITDERQPPPFASRGREYLAEMRRRESFKEVRLTLAEYADLDALQATVWLARSGDLEIGLPHGETRALTDRDVIASHHRQGRYRQAAVLRDVLG